MNLLRADLARYGSPGAHTYQRSETTWRDIAKALVMERALWAICEWRFRQWMAAQRRPLPLVGKVIGTITRHVSETITGIELPTNARIGPGLHIAHAGPIVIHRETVAGENLTIHPQITIGVHEGGVPTFGDRVFIGPGARVFGAIHVGDDALVGANAVVMRDVPAANVATGVPAQARPNPRPHWMTS
jgi:serine O-acetyltransferase